MMLDQFRQNNLTLFHDEIDVNLGITGYWI